jgi:hypothetical protein
MTLQIDSYGLESIPTERVPDLNIDSNLLLDFEIRDQNPIRIEFFCKLYVIAKSNTVVPPAIVVVGEQTNPDVFEYLHEVAQLDVWPVRQEFFLASNNNLLVEINVDNQDNYLDPIPTTVSGVTVTEVSGTRPFWS